MAKVPYNPVPSVAPSNQGIPGISVDTPAAAFGGASAQALQGLGNTIEKASDEIFQRAIALQDMQNQTEAREADTEYIKAAGKLHADYNSLQGKAAVQAFPKYQEDLESARKEIRERMSNDASRRMYDSASMSLMNRSVFNGAGYAATQNKQWAIGTSQARVAALGDQALSLPNDERAFRESIESVKVEVGEQGNLQGWGPEQVKQATAERVSDLWTKRIEGIGKTEPFKAKKMLDDALKSGELRGEQIAKATNFVNQQMYTVGARNISHNITSGGDLYFGSRKVTLPQAREAIGTFESGGNYQAVGVETKYGRALGKYQVMEQFLPEFLKKAGMPAMTKEEFLKNSKAQDQLFDSIFGGYMEKHGNFNDAASMWFSGKTMAEAGNRKDANGTTVPGYIASTNRILAQHTPLADRIERGKQLAANISPENPLLEDYVTTRISADFSTDQRIKLNDQYLNRQVIETGLMGGKDGKLPTTLDELKAMDPDVERAWTALDPTKQRRYLSILAKNSKGDVPWTQENLREYQKLKGMAQSDPAEFMEQDVVGMNLPLSARKEFIGLQGKLKSKAESDPRVTKALGILGPDLQNAGVTKAQNKDEYYKFVGSLQDAITDWQADNQKPPNAKDIQAIGARLLQERSVGLWSREADQSGWGKTPMYRISVPDTEKEKIKADPAWANIGITPTDEQIQRVYTRQLYQQLYGGKAKQDAQRPEVPMSR